MKTAWFSRTYCEVRGDKTAYLKMTWNQKWICQCAFHLTKNVPFWQVRNEDTDLTLIAWSVTWSEYDQPRYPCMSSPWSVHDQSRDRCVISHVNSACSATWSVHDQPRDQCMISKWSVHDQSHDQCMISHVNSACSVTCSGPAELRDYCLLICLTIASWAARFLPVICLTIASCAA